MWPGIETTWREIAHTLVIFVAFLGDAILRRMAYLPHPHPSLRAPRVCVTPGEPVSFSLEGKQIQGILEAVSPTGGSARISEPLNPGTLAEILLRTSLGPVRASVELLHPQSQGQSFAQAFRFLAFDDDDYARFKRTLEILRAGGSGEFAKWWKQWISRIQGSQAQQRLRSSKH